MAVLDVDGIGPHSLRSVDSDKRPLWTQLEVTPVQVTAGS